MDGRWFSHRDERILQRQASEAERVYKQHGPTIPVPLRLLYFIYWCRLRGRSAELRHGTVVDRLVSGIDSAANESGDPWDNKPGGLWANITCFPVAYEATEHEPADTGLGYVIYSCVPVDEHVRYTWLPEWNIWFSAANEGDATCTNTINTVMGKVRPTDSSFVTIRAPTVFDGPSFSVALYAALIGLPMLTYTGEIRLDPATGRYQIGPIGMLPQKLAFCARFGLCLVFPRANVAFEGDQEHVTLEQLIESGFRLGADYHKAYPSALMVSGLLHMTESVVHLWSQHIAAWPEGSTRVSVGASPLGPSPELS